MALQSPAADKAVRGAPTAPLGAWVWAAAGTHVAALLVLAGRYGYHRDELYFRLLRPAWGYLDQPPLTPLVVWFTRVAIGDSVGVLRLPAVVAAAVAVLLVAALARELGGDRSACALAAWGYAAGTLPLTFGHVFLTNSFDTVVWLGVLLCVVRAALRAQGRWWVAAGAVAGAGTYNKWLVVFLLLALAGGLLLAGPRRALPSRHVLTGVIVGLVVGLPNLLYQAGHGWPQIGFGAALSEHKAADTRVEMWPILLIMLGPPQTAVWVAGLVGLWRRSTWRPVRFVAAAFPLLLLLTFVAGAQPTYPFGLVAGLWAAGAVVTVDWWRRGRARRAAAVGVLALGSAVNAVIALPLLPVAVLGGTPVPAVNQAARDTVGWPTYVGQVAAAYQALPAQERPDAVVVASNYGEAGAIDRFGPALGLGPVYSAHNELYRQSRPPEDATVAIVVGGQVARADTLFRSCRTVARLDNGLGIDNEEQGQPVAVCRDPVGGWTEVWPRLRHED